MGAEQPIEQFYDHVRLQALSDPKGARQTFSALRAEGGERLTQFLDLASRPGESRVRGVIAVGVRIENRCAEMEPWLHRWHPSEPDEFTRGAIEAALATLTAGRSPAPVTVKQSLPPDLIAAYRYVADRLCHRVRNAMTAPNSQLLRLETVLHRVEDPSVLSELLEILGTLKTGFGRVGKGVQFDVGDDYLTWQSIELVGWLKGASNEYRNRFGNAALEVSGPAAGRRLRVRATRFLLETAFGNIWCNALQAAGTPCVITVDLDSKDGRLEMVVADNGPGFSVGLVDVAFRETFSTNPGVRGRGLLEIADAVLQLQGEIDLTEVAPGEFRIRIRLPVESP